MLEQHFDVVVIGGGISGVAIARQCAWGGKRTLLVEKNDFAAGTTSRSTRIIHGGLRYLEHGDIVLAYTDGLVEPENVYGEMFGEERLKDLLVKHARADSSEIIARTMEAVMQWTGSSELQDDMTMVVARRI